VSNPLFWLGLSVGLLAVSIVVLLVLAIPLLVGLARTTRSAEQLLETLNRELPATLKALRQTGEELGDLAEDVTSTTQSARQIVTHVDQSLASVQKQAHQAQRTSRSLWAGTRAAWRALTASNQTNGRIHRKRRKYPPTPRPPIATAVEPTEANGILENDAEREQNTELAQSASIKTDHSVPPQPAMEHPGESPKI